MLKLIKKILWTNIALFIFSILFSSIFPGRIKIVDSVRMLAQRPIIKLLGKIKMDDIPLYTFSDNDNESDISFEELKMFITNLPPGSIYFTSTRNYAITEFIPGKWKHTGIFLGTKEQLIDYFGKNSNIMIKLDSLINSTDIYVLDSYSNGVSVHPIQDLSNMRIKSYMTDFAAFIYKGTKKNKIEYIQKALNYLNRDYDFDWLTEDPETIYCSELIYHSFKTIGFDIQKRTTTFNRDIFTPDNLFEFLDSISNSSKSFKFYGKISKIEKNNETNNRLEQN